MVNDMTLQTIGLTPMVKIFRPYSGIVYAMAKYLNPGGSIKDRAASYIIEKKIQWGRLIKGMTIIQATLANTRIGLSLTRVQKKL
jgi:cysteine synthase